MSMTVKKINNYFKTALKNDVDKVKEDLILSDRQQVIFDMFYIKKQNINFIADSLNVCPMVISNELKDIRLKIIKVI